MKVDKVDNDHWTDCLQYIKNEKWRLRYQEIKMNAKSCTYLVTIQPEKFW